MEKPLFPGRKTFSKSPLTALTEYINAYQKIMVYDFSKVCKTYDAKSYRRLDFATTRCPKCPAIGRFNLHGSYHRHVLYFDMRELVHRYIEIKRVKCCSCKTTHAVMPGDIIPYKLLSLFVVLFVLDLYYLSEMPVLKIATALGFSFQFIYSALAAFRRHAAGIYQYFKEITRGTVRLGLDEAGVLSLIRKPVTDFQSSYIKFNKRPCFMCKFLTSPKAPPVGRMPHILSLQGQQHNT
jgi:hypothetical protein